MRESARPALYRGRSGEQLDEDVRKAFSEIGIRLEFKREAAEYVPAPAVISR